jgi:2-dehydropantoate 2-reductase
MKVAVYGAGGIGAYFGGRLAQAGADVHLIARGSHLDALRRRGLEVRSTLGDFHLHLPATDDPADIGPCDWVLFCVKAYDTAEAATRLPGLLGAGSAVVSLQNGIDNEGIIAGVVGPDRVVGGAAFILSTIAEPGVVAHTGGPARVVFGELNGTETDRVRALRDAFRAASVAVEVSRTIETVLWNKFAFICAHAGMTAASRAPIGEIRSVPESWEMFGALSEEVCAVGRAGGVQLPADATEQHRTFASGLEPDLYSSLHYDLEHGKRMELEALHGAVVRRGAASNVPTPMNRAVYALLKPHAARRRA